MAVSDCVLYNDYKLNEPTKEMKIMNMQNKAILIRSIINKLNESVINKNKKLSLDNLHYKQTKIHGMDMFLRLSFMTDKKINDIAKACGI